MAFRSSRPVRPCSRCIERYCRMKPRIRRSPRRPPKRAARFSKGRLTVDDASQGHSSLRTSVREPLLILMAIAAGIILIVCANVANLLIARGAARRREMALRLALGGSRWQIARLLLVESLVLATTGTAAGLLIASWGADALLGFYESPDAALAVHSGPDLRILFFTCVIAVTTALVAGLTPAVRGTRVDLVTTLKGSGGGGKRAGANAQGAGGRAGVALVSPAAVRRALRPQPR